MIEYIAKLMELEQLLLKGKQELEEIVQILENEISATKKFIDKR